MWLGARAALCATRRPASQTSASAIIRARRWSSSLWRLSSSSSGYGFPSRAFVAGIGLPHVEKTNGSIAGCTQFSEALEEALTALLLIFLGGALPALWPHLQWHGILVAIALLLVIRPLAGWAALWRSPLAGRERAVVAFYGVRGIGSVYYLSYASGQIEFVDASQIWALVVFTIFASTLLHGATARLVVDRVIGVRAKVP